MSGNYNPVEKAYETLRKVFANDRAGWDEALVAIEDALGYLGEALAEKGGRKNA